LRDQLEYNKKTEFHTRHEAAPAFVRTEALTHTNEVFDVDESEINRIWDGLDGYTEPEKAWEIRNPKMAPLLMGAGVIKNLGKAATQFNVEKFMVVSDPFMKEVGRTDEIQLILKASGIDSAVFADVEPDPPVELIEKAGEFYNRKGCSGIIAIGGGSSMDSGKAIALRVSHPGNLPEFESVMGGTARIKDILPPLITIPTTSGTGSDVNSYAVVTDKEREVKFALVSDYLLPKLAVVDPNLCVSMPPLLTAETGIDALSHCVEAYVALGTPYQPYCDALALQGTKLIGKSLRRACENGNDMDARMDMCMAAIFGGVAFAKSLGIAHAIGHALGAQHHVSHGKSVAVGLLFAVRANKKYCEDQYRDMAWALDRSDDLEQALLKLYKDLNLATRLEDLGVPKSAFKRIAFAASREVANIASNPAPMDEKKIFELLE
jgi:alcohol dehydrogenase class IV